ncbi:MAG: hypothetical protein P4L46_06535 [Fimbriimonas sp.]|nr:hypothetical protein [Fimbriimonas sp.]
MFLKKLVIIVAVAAIVGSAMAQGGGGRGQGMRGNPNSLSGLLNRADVQKDLGITDEQKTKLTDIRTASRQKMQDARTAAGDDRAAMQAAMQKVGEEVGKEQMAVLTADQAKRLKEIFVQVRGSQAILNTEIQSDLGLSDDQKAKIKDLQERQTKANQEIQQKVRDQSIDQAEARTEREKNNKVLADEIDKILTDAQKSKLKDMGGKPFTADPAPAGRGGGGGGGGF